MRTSSVEHGKTTLERLTIRLNQADPLSTVEQIARQIALFVVDGVLLPGERLPSAEAAAQHFGIGRRVVSNAYQLLARKRITINGTASGVILANLAPHAARRYLLSLSARALVHEAHSLNLGEDEVVGIILAALSPSEHDEESTGHIIEAEEMH